MIYRLCHITHHVSVPSVLYSQRSWSSNNALFQYRSDLGHIYSFIKCKLFQQYCCSFYGAPLWSLNGKATGDICIAWRKALQMLYGLHPMTHCDILAGLSNLKPLGVQLK